MALKGKIAVVTGGASGIGRSICLRLAHQGVNVAVLDLNLSAAEQVAREVTLLGCRSVALEVDVARLSLVVAAAERVQTVLGPVQILVSSAGIAGFVPLLQMSEEQWDRMIAVHLKGTFNLTRSLGQGMVNAGWGRIVNISSAAGLNGGGAGLTNYAAAKAGIIGFTKALAHELGPFGVTVNAIAPGLIDTPLIRQAGAPDDLYQRVVQRMPIRRIGKPEDIAAACAYLVSEEAGFVTGQVLSPNGGGVM